MKIGIMTWFTYHNYGTALQLTALAETIRSMGHHTKLINYTPHPRAYNKASRSLASRIFNKLKYHISRKYLAYSSPNREKLFNEFIASHISFTSKADTTQELELCAEQFDAVVCGSDQIWSPLCFDTPYYLDFVHGRTKIAYAPSIDPAHIRNEEIREKIIEMCSDFDFISVREKKTAEVFSQWLNRKVENVLDPTLLLDAHDWEKYITRPYKCNIMVGGGG